MDSKLDSEFDSGSDSEDISEVFSRFDLDEQIFLSKLILLLNCKNKQEICNNTGKMRSLLRNLRSVLSNVKPRNLPEPAIVRYKRFLYLTSQGLNAILELSQNKLVKFIFERELNVVESAFYRIEEYDDIETDVNNDNVDMLMFKINQILTKAKKYNLSDFYKR